MMITITSKTGKNVREAHIHPIYSNTYKVEYVDICKGSHYVRITDTDVDGQKVKLWIPREHALKMIADMQAALASMPTD